MAPHTILFIAANPTGTDQRALDEQARAVQVELECAGRRDCFQFETQWAAQPLDLLREMVKHKPTVVHFCGGRVGANGAPSAGVYLQAADGRAQLVPAKALANAFDAAGSVQLVVLDACYSEEHAAAVAAYIDCVVGMAGETVDGAAVSFAIGLYGGLGEGESVAAAFKQGCAAIGLTGAGDPGQPQLRVRTGVDANRLVLTERREESDRERVDADVEWGEPLPAGGARQRGSRRPATSPLVTKPASALAREREVRRRRHRDGHRSSSSRYPREAMNKDADAHQDLLPAGGAHQRRIDAAGNVMTHDETGVGASQQDVHAGGDVHAVVTNLTAAVASRGSTGPAPTVEVSLVNLVAGRDVHVNVPDVLVLAAGAHSPSLTKHTESEPSEPGEPEAFDVFLCHNSADKEEVQRVAERLRTRGIKPWLDREQLRPGFPAARGLQDQIGSISAVAVFVGESGFGPWQDLEILASLGEFVRRGCPVIPVLLTDCPDEPSLPPFLKMLTWVDLGDADPDPIERLCWGISGKRLSEMPRMKAARWWRRCTWRSSIESVNAGKVSVLAIAETVAASAVYAWIAWRFGTLHLTISACVAPLLLLRTQRSTLLALRWFHALFDLDNADAPDVIARHEEWKKGNQNELENYGFGFDIISFWLKLPLSLIAGVLAVPPILIRVTATAVAVIARPLESFSMIPRNWWTSVSSIDSFMPLEMLSGAYENYGHLSDANFSVNMMLIPSKGIISSIQDATRLSLLAVTFSLAICLWLPTLFYRWSMKGSALIYSPLIWIVYSSMTRPLRVHLRDIRNRAYSRIARRFAALVIALFLMKAFINYAWVDLELAWNSISGNRILNAVVVPDLMDPLVLLA